MDLNKIRGVQQQIITRVAIGYDLVYLVDTYTLKEVIQTAIIASDWIKPMSNGIKVDYIGSFIISVDSSYPVEDYPELWI